MTYVNHIPGLLAALPTIDGKALLKAKVLFPVTALTLLAALLLPLLGPTGRTITLPSGSPPICTSTWPACRCQHLHDHEAFHPHEAPNVDSLEVENSGPVLESSVIFMPQEGEGLSVSTLGITFALLTSVVALALPTVITLITPRSQRALRAIVLYPEPPPPRLAL